MTRSVTVMAEEVAVGAGELVLLREFSLTLESGDFAVVVGPNGAGKSTLGRVLAARERPLAGRLLLLGAEVGASDMRAVRAQIGFVSAKLGSEIEQRERVVDVVALGRYGGLRSAWFHLDIEDRSEANELLEMVGLAGKARLVFGSLSSGERERVLVARGAMGSPRLMIFDEPTSHLDIGAREDVLEALGALRRGATVPPTVLMVTHHVEEIPDYASHAIVVGNGHNAVVGPIGKTLTGAVLSQTFGRSIELVRRRGRYSALVRPAKGLG